MCVGGEEEGWSSIFDFKRKETYQSGVWPDWALGTHTYPSLRKQPRTVQGCSWWLSGEEHALNAGDTGLIPYPGKVPWVVAQLSPCATITKSVALSPEPQLLSPGTIATEAQAPRPTLCNKGSCKRREERPAAAVKTQHSWKEKQVTNRRVVQYELQTKFWNHGFTFLKSENDTDVTQKMQEVNTGNILMPFTLKWFSKKKKKSKCGKMLNWWIHEEYRGIHCILSPSL